MRFPIQPTAMPAHGTPPLLRLGSGRIVRMQLAATIVQVETGGNIIRGADGCPLPDHCAVEVGYFSKSTLTAPFSGPWVPLIGANAPQSNSGVSVLRTGISGARRGELSWCRSFYPEIDALPASGTQLALRIYDHANPRRARHFNSVSHPSWWFRSPRAPLPAMVEMCLDTSCLWESGSAGAFETRLPMPLTSLASAWRRLCESFSRPQHGFRSQPVPVASAF